jgi:hypothetical protein
MSLRSRSECNQLRIMLNGGLPSWQCSALEICCRLLKSFDTALLHFSGLKDLNPVGPNVRYFLHQFTKKKKKKKKHANFTRQVTMVTSFVTYFAQWPCRSS